MKLRKKIIISLLIISIIFPYLSSVFAISENILDSTVQNESTNEILNETEDEEIKEDENFISNEIVNDENAVKNDIVIDDDNNVDNNIDNEISNTIGNIVDNNETSNNTIKNEIKHENVINDIKDDNSILDDFQGIEKILKVEYSTHIEKIGWQDKVFNGQMSGTSGLGLRLEGIKINVTGPDTLSGNIEYSTHIQNIGWQDKIITKVNSKDDEVNFSGTSGLGLRLEAIKINLSGEISNDYDVYYRVHVQNIGWTGWAKNGAEAGSAGYGFRLEGIEIKLIEKDGKAPGKTDDTYYVKAPTVAYTTHVQNIGWQEYVEDGKIAGTNGLGLRLEGIKLKLKNTNYDGDIIYSTHIQNIGWQEFKSNDEVSGTSGKGLRLEAIKIDLTGTLKEKYDIYYRVHAQNAGWLSWAKNGLEAGTEGYGFRLEGIQIVIVDKGSKAPGDTETPFKKCFTGKITIDEPESTDVYTVPNKDGSKPDSLKVRGWAISTDEEARIEVELNGKKYTNITRTVRTDINNKTVPGWEEAIKNTEKSGFETKIDISTLEEKEYKITVYQINRYGDIIGKTEKTFNVKRPRYTGKMCIDKPKPNYNVVIQNNQPAQVEFNGWAISDDTDAILKLYVNDKLWIPNVTRYDRKDSVNNDTIPNSEEQIAATKDAGFASLLTFDKNMLPGEYKVRIEQISKYGHVISSIERVITLENHNFTYKGRISIDSPKDLRIVIKERNDSFKIRGWAISNDSKAKVEIYIDDKLFDPNPAKEIRPDVNVDSLPNNKEEVMLTPIAGFTTTDLPINVLGLSSDIHTIKIRLIDRNGRIIEESTSRIRVVDKNTKGIDVSTHNGVVDWKSVAENGFTFAILRVGYGKNSNQKDPYFEENYRKCKELGISVGAYLYSYAMDPDGARLEADNCLNWLGGRKLDLPVYYDLENTTPGYPQHTLPKDVQTNMVISFCDRIQSAGYRAGVYTNKNWMEENLDMSRIEDKYSVWIAHYTEGTGQEMAPNYNPIQTNYQGKYNMWQYTSNGSINGKKFDFNIFYY